VRVRHTTNYFYWRADMSYSPLIAYMRRKTLVEKDNILLGIVGSTGSGKSTSAIRIAEQYDPSFHIGRIIFSPKDFLKALADFDINSRGKAIIFDEAGIGNNAKKWYAYVNRAINEVMQSVRFRRSLIIFTMPSWKDIDSSNRRLFKMEINTLGVNYEEEYVWAKVYLRKYVGASSWAGTQKEYILTRPKMYWRRLTKDSEEISRMCLVDMLKIRKPENMELVKEYEEKKEKWAENLYMSHAREIELMDEIADVNIPKTYEEMKKAVIRNPEKYCQWVMTRNAWKLRIEKVRRAFQMNRVTARMFCQKLAADPEAQKRGIIWK